MANFAIIAHGGKQYNVKEGTTLLLDRTKGIAGAPIAFPEVLMVSDEEGTSVQVGDPVVKNAKVEGTIVAHVRGEKKITIKYHPKVHNRKKTGFRPDFTSVKITKIS